MDNNTEFEEKINRFNNFCKSKGAKNYPYFHIADGITSRMTPPLGQSFIRNLIYTLIITNIRNFLMIHSSTLILTAMFTKVFNDNPSNGYVCFYSFNTFVDMSQLAVMISVTISIIQAIFCEIVKRKHSIPKWKDFK